MSESARWWASRAVVAVAIGAVVAGGADLADRPSREAIGPGLVRVDVDIHHSVFALEDLRVRKGTTVEFVLHNDDPINHELIVGDAGVHALHERGHDARHPPLPGEVSVGPGQTASTVYTFDDVGGVEYACHLPAHYGFGMHGEITVVA